MLERNDCLCRSIPQALSLCGEEDGVAYTIKRSDLDDVCMSEIKQRLLRFCFGYVDAKIAASRKAMDEAQKEANLETKSSAGDKYETGRSMMQLEKQKYALHLREALRMRVSLEAIDAARVCEQVEKGAVVETDDGHFFFSIAAGQVNLDLAYRCLSLDSPLGQALNATEEGDIVVFRGKEIEILSIF